MVLILLVQLKSMPLKNVFLESLPKSLARGCVRCYIGGGGPIYFRKEIHMLGFFLKLV